MTVVLAVHSIIHSFICLIHIVDMTYTDVALTPHCFANELLIIKIPGILGLFFGFLKFVMLLSFHSVVRNEHVLYVCVAS